MKGGDAEKLDAGWRRSRHLPTSEDAGSEEKRSQWDLMHDGEDARK